MIRNNFKVAFRSIWRNKFYSFISIFGLAVGLIAGILILIWCQDERSYYQTVKDSQNIYRAIPVFVSGGDTKSFPTVPPAAGYVARQIPGVEKEGRLIGNFTEMVLRNKDKTFSEKNSVYLEPALFSLLGYTFIEGNADTPFQGDHSIVLTEPFAKKYFGNEDPVGKMLTREDMKESYLVTGVVRAPEHTEMRYDYFLPFHLLNQFYGNPASTMQGFDGDWKNYDFEMYLQLNPRVSTEAVAAKLTELQKASVTDEITKTLNYRLQPLTKIHLYNPDGSEGSITMVRIFTWVAIVILLIASINYINLTTARAAQRAREIGVRKIIGAAKRQLFFQFLSETFIVFLLAMIVSIVAIVILFPLYNSLTGKQLSFHLFDPSVLRVLGITMAATLLISAIYPAILLSSFRPLLAIKGKFSIGRGNHFMRKFLVVSQFCASVIFIISTIIIGKQLDYVRAINLGWNKENVFRVPLKNITGGTKYEAVRNQLLEDPAISGVTAAGQDIMRIASNTTTNDWPGKEAGRSLLIYTIPIERNFLSVMNLKLAEGKGFTGTKADSNYYLLNEQAVKDMGLKDPVGKSFSVYGIKGTIAGVVQDFHFNDLHQKIGPCVLLWVPALMTDAYIRTDGAHAQQAIAAVEKVWKTYNADIPFEFTFLDEAYNQMYADDQRTGLLFKVFAFIAIFISCLGLLGLMTYTAQLKTREIGIRKVLGASVSSVTGLLAKDFVGLVVLAILIASPIGWYFMNRWLQSFAYRSDIPWWAFPVAGVAALLIAVATIGVQAVRAASANPVKSLRTE